MRMVALSYLSIVRFSGTDAGDFLHGQVSADVLALDSGKSTFACYCDPKGRVLALMLICRIEGDYHVIISSHLAETVVNRLKIYVMRSKVSIDVLDGWQVSGRQANDEVDMTPGSTYVIPVPDSTQQFVVTSSDTAPVTDSSSQDAWKTSQLKRGISWLNPDSSGQFLPQMLGFDQLGAVNFRKGCYPGQEIVARTHYLGKVKRHPRLLCTRATIYPEPLDKINVLSDGQAYKAIVADYGQDKEGTCLLVVTRMDPDLTADQIEYQEQLASLI